MLLYEQISKSPIDKIVYLIYKLIESIISINNFNDLLINILIFMLGIIFIIIPKVIYLLKSKKKKRKKKM